MSAVDVSSVFEGMTAVGTLAVPVVVAIVAARASRRVQRWEASQWRNQELVKTRLQYYQDLIPQLNDLMCYFTFIGPWRTMTPPAVIELKRQLDRDFHCAVPLFSDELTAAYNVFMEGCFRHFGEWGQDALLRTGFGRRRDGLGDQWRPEWESLFVPAAQAQVGADQLTAIRDRYQEVVRLFVSQIDLTPAQGRYVVADVVRNAH